MTRTLSSLSALVLVALLASPVDAAVVGTKVIGIPGTSAASGGGGAVASVTAGSGCATISPTTGAVVVTSTGCLAAASNLSDLASASTARTNLGAQQTLTSASATNLTSKFILQGTTDTGAPNAQFLGALATGLLKNTTATGVLSAAAAGTDYQVPLTFSTGLVNTSNAITWSLAAGLAGGQTLTCGTASGDGCTFTSTSNATKGKYIFGSTSHLYFDEANDLLVMGNSGTVPTSGLGATLVQFNRSSATSQYVLQSNNSTGGVGYLFQSATATALGSPPYLEIHLNASTGADSARILLNPGAGQANSFLSIGNQGATAGDDIFIATNSATERTRWLMAGGQTNINMPYESWTSAGTALAQANGTTFEYQTTPPSQASASGSKWDGLKIDPITATFTGGVAITTATGVNLFDVEAPTITSSSATTIAVASTLSLGGPPVAGGSVTITTPYTLNVRGGNAFFGGSIAITNTLATPGSGVIVTTDAPTAVVSLSLKYINMQVNGVTTYVLALQ